MKKIVSNATTGQNSKTGILMIIIAALLLSSVIIYVITDNKVASAVVTTPQPTTAAGAVIQSDGSLVYKADAAEATPIPADALELPQSVDGGKIIVSSLFPFNGFNPDAGMAECTEVAGLQITNTSGQYLTRAGIDVILANGTSLSFIVTDIPVGAEVYAFDVNNTTGITGNAITDISVNAEYSDALALPDGVTASVNGTTITLTNESTTAYDSFTVIYHMVMNDVLFGGTSYSVPVSLPTKSTAEVEASEAWLGLAEVVGGR